MNKYDPEQPLNSNSWLSLSEDDRINLAMESHDSSDLFEQSLTLHASIHVVVENQLALNTEYVPETLTALIKQGMSRHDAVHAIGAVVLEELLQVRENGESFNSKQYKKRFGDLIKGGGRPFDYGN
ncbi:MAG: hypothetical protein V7784_16825 [Oceanospirillaceae bacterium]